jgi:HSP20 family protein
MPTIRYFNQSAPFWDFVASLEDQITDSPLFNESNESSETLRGDPTEKPSGTTEKPEAADKDDDEGHCAGKGNARGHCGGRGGFHRRRGGFRGGCGGPYGFGGPAFTGFPLGGHPWTHAWRASSSEASNNQDHTPPADVFDTEDSYVVHISLPGVKKEDVGINWNADKSELSVAGVVYRTGDEEFLKTLALDERTVGAFEKKVRFGNERHPAKVDEDAITAKLEDGQYFRCLVVFKPAS